jgi:Cd2+/Zn2+-exporting ATPase
MRTIPFDRSGTLIEGRSRAADVVALTGFARTGWPPRWRMAPAPVGRAILEWAAADGVPMRPAKDAPFRASPSRR